MNIVITGASKGIGRAIALKFANNGHKVAVCARGEQALKSLSEASQGNIIYQTCDVSKKAELGGFHHFVKEHFEQTDILINNAGVFLPGEINNEEDGTLEKLIETNLYSTYYLSRLFLPDMIVRRSGHIFNMCSTASIKAYPNGGSYGISKFALYGMTKSMREELKPHNIKVTAVLPGATLTESWAGTDLPDERFIQSEDIAEMVYSASFLSPSALIEEILIRPQLGDIQ